MRKSTLNTTARSTKVRLLLVCLPSLVSSPLPGVLICAEEFKALLEELKKSGAATVAGSADKMLVDLVFSALDKDDRFRPLRSSLSALTHATQTPNPSHLSVVFYHPSRAQWRPQPGGNPRRLSHSVRRRANGARPLVESVISLYDAAFPYRAASHPACPCADLSLPQPSARSRLLTFSGFSSASMTTETASLTNVLQHAPAHIVARV